MVTDGGEGVRRKEGRGSMGEGDGEGVGKSESKLVGKWFENDSRFKGNPGPRFEHPHLFLFCFGTSEGCLEVEPQPGKGDRVEVGSGLGVGSWRWAESQGRGLKPGVEHPDIQGGVHGDTKTKVRPSHGRTGKILPLGLWYESGLFPSPTPASHRTSGPECTEGLVLSQGIGTVWKSFTTSDISVFLYWVLSTFGSVATLPRTGVDYYLLSVRTSESRRSGPQ